MRKRVLVVASALVGLAASSPALGNPGVQAYQEAQVQAQVRAELAARAQAQAAASARARAQAQALAQARGEQQGRFRTISFSQPATARISSNFGYRFHPTRGRWKMHEGTDIAVPHGTPIVATADGWVTFAGWNGGYGNLVKLLHMSGYETRFAHMSRFIVANGQYVRRGTVIGYVGSTGQSTGPHLHYEVRYVGQARDPAAYM